MRDRKAYMREFMRRKRAAAKGEVVADPQHAAHVAAWAGTLTAMRRLEHRAWGRRCLMETRR